VRRNPRKNRRWLSLRGVDFDYWWPERMFSVGVESRFAIHHHHHHHHHRHCSCYDSYNLATTPFLKSLRNFTQQPQQLGTLGSARSSRTSRAPRTAATTRAASFGCAPSAPATAGSSRFVVVTKIVFVVFFFNLTLLSGTSSSLRFVLHLIRVKIFTYLCS